MVHTRAWPRISPSTKIYFGCHFRGLYVDDLALMSICPRELQSMLHACQQWSIRNRMQINTEKTKVMAFFETPALLRARGGLHQPSATMPPFHVYSPFPTSDPRSHPILEVSQFEYLGLILDPKLTMHLATVEAIRRASHGQALVLPSLTRYVTTRTPPNLPPYKTSGYGSQ